MAIAKRSAGGKDGEAVSPAASVEPSNRAFNDPAPGQDGEPFRRVGTLDDLDLDLAADAAQSAPELWPLIATVGVELQRERVEAEQRAHEQHAAVAVLDVGGVDDGVHQQALRVHQNVALLAADLLARIIPWRIDAAPPFSAPFTLGLSMTAAEGLASRPACSRHWT